MSRMWPLSTAVPVPQAYLRLLVWSFRKWKFGTSTLESQPVGPLPHGLGPSRGQVVRVRNWNCVSVFCLQCDCMMARCIHFLKNESTDSTHYYRTSGSSIVLVLCFGVSCAFSLLLSTLLESLTRVFVVVTVWIARMSLHIFISARQ
jgi:hypothetical protein